MIQQPSMSGHCRFPETANPANSHDRCHRNGAGNTARPSKEFQPCACMCHYESLDQFECGCGAALIETTIENDDPRDVDEDGVQYPVYLHVDPKTGRVTGQECP